jgi:signal transduction histidine kinase
VRSNALDDLVVAYAIAIPITVALSLLFGWWAAGRALAPVARLTSTARELSERNLDRRIALDGPQDELKELADTLDAMLTRLDGAFQSQRRFAADVSHEIRTPLSIIKAEAEVTLGDGLSTERERRLARAVLEATDRAEALIDSLLALGRSESTMLSHTEVDLAELAGDVVGERIEAADAAGVVLELDLGAGAVEGDPYLLERLLANLVDNGITHNLDTGGWLRLSVDTVGASVLVRVENSGPQLTDADVARIAEPFQRLSDDRPGFGLGMAIVRSVVTAHDGIVNLRARPEGGLAVSIELPGRERPQAPAPLPVDVPV